MEGSTDLGDRLQSQAAASTEPAGMMTDGADDGAACVATEADLEAFSRLAVDERRLTEPLRGVLAETALTGRVRYKWSLLGPLVDFIMEEVLMSYDAETHVEVGPPGPDCVSATIDRFKGLLAAFANAPWTFQRLCEVLLEPKRQYTRLPKLVCAIEKCLLVTTELPPTPATDLPSRPQLSSLGPVNVNPPRLQQYSHPHHGSGSHGGGPEDGGTFTSSVLEVRHGPHAHMGNHTGAPEHIEEDHWPEGKGPFKPIVPIHRPAAGHGSPGSGSSPGSSGAAPAASGSPGSTAAPHADAEAPDGMWQHPSDATLVERQPSVQPHASSALGRRRRESDGDADERAVPVAPHGAAERHPDVSTSTAATDAVPMDTGAVCEQPGIRNVSAPDTIMTGALITASSSATTGAGGGGDDGGSMMAIDGKPPDGG